MLMAINEPPILIDGARVVEYAALEPPREAGMTSVVVEGVTLSLDTVNRLVVAEDFVKGGVFLMHCNDEWETIAAAHFRDAEAARRSAEACYAGVGMTWFPFRPLTSTEQREVQTTRDFLRELARDFPPD